MTCTHLNAELPLFHFGRLAAKERLEIESHLKQCTHCLSEYFSIKQDLELAGQENILPDSTLKKKIFAEAISIQRDTRKKSRRDSWLSGFRLGELHWQGTLAVAAFASTVAVFLTLTLAHHQNRSNDRSSNTDESFQTIGEAIDKGNELPGHINTL